MIQIAFSVSFPRKHYWVLFADYGGESQRKGGDQQCFNICLAETDEGVEPRLCGCPLPILA